jgi:hypothetical protein
MAKRREEEQNRTHPPRERAKAKPVPRRGAVGKEAPAPGPARRRRWLGLVGGVAALVMAVALGAAYLAWPDLMSRLAGDRQAADSAAPEAVEARADSMAGDVAARLDGLGQRLAALGGRLTALEEAPPDESDLAARVAALEERAAAGAPPDDGGGAAGLAERIEALERTAADAAGGAALSVLESKIERLVALAGDLDRRLAALEKRSAAAAGTRPAMLLAVGQLRAALRGSGPFEAELDTLRAVAADDADVAVAVATLAARAAVGVPTVEVLRARFGAIAGPVVRAADAAEERSWLDQLLDPLAGLVTVRPVGDVPGASTDAVVARAEARLKADDLAAAVAEVERLEGAPADLAADWLAAARARLAAERALAALEARAVGALGGG